MNNFDPASIGTLLALMTLIPAALICTTSFLKIAVVLMLVRNALGVQQVPPSMAVYGLALVLTLYVMGPAVSNAAETIFPQQAVPATIDQTLQRLGKAAEPFREFMHKHSDPKQRRFFLSSVERMWTPEMARSVTERDFLVLLPAFMISELTDAFKIGFLLYLPFVVIDIVVSSILLALGMMMVSPMTISLPLKLLLFVMVDGWSRLLQGLVMSYQT